MLPPASLDTSAVEAEAGTSRGGADRPLMLTPFFAALDSGDWTLLLRGDTASRSSELRQVCQERKIIFSGQSKCDKRLQGNKGELQAL